MDEITVASFTTVLGIGVIVALIEQVVLSAVKLDESTQDRFGPLIAVGLGLIVAAVGIYANAIGGRQEIIQVLVNGVVGGLSAMGIHDTVKSAGVPV